MADTRDDSAELQQQHAQTWQGFTAMMTWGTVAVAIVAAGVVFLIAS